MARSMTGFGRHEVSNDDFRLSVEIRSVNHRYLDLNLKIGHRLNIFENKIRTMLRESIGRGKADVAIQLFINSGAGEDIVYNKALATLYAESILKISDEFGLVNDLTATRLATMKDVLTLSETTVDEDSLWALLSDTLDKALAVFNEQRLIEGERLKNDLLQKLDEITDIVKVIEERCPDLIEEYKERVTKRIGEMIEEGRLDANRIAMEVVMYADKIAIDEEIVRLSSHVKSFKDTLLKDGEVGRKLDFIAQEMNREANTILSKTQDVQISDMGIELKTLIEKIREQIQNLV